jgi:hypothetical protein
MCQFPARTRIEIVYWETGDLETPPSDIEVRSLGGKRTYRYKGQGGRKKAASDDEQWSARGSWRKKEATEI